MNSITARYQTHKPRELLELAAKAYWGNEIDDVCSIEWSDLDDCIAYIHADNQDHNGIDQAFLWNPLNDDGDALRLAVKLDIAITPYPVYGKPKHSVLAQLKNLDDSRFEVMELHGGEPEAATRRAIVRAAAEIGRAMP